jgi:hypothetical protein
MRLSPAIEGQVDTPDDFGDFAMILAVLSKADAPFEYSLFDVSESQFFYSIHAISCLFERRD